MQPSENSMSARRAATAVKRKVPRRNLSAKARKLQAEELVSLRWAHVKRRGATITSTASGAAADPAPAAGG
jgi:hypothetical protein